MSRISGFTAFDAGFQKYHYEKVTPENKRADKSLLKNMARLKKQLQNSRILAGVQRNF